MTFIFSNNAESTLTTAIDNVATQLVVLDATLFPSSASPSTPCKITLQDVDTGAIEICDCTGISGNTLTVIRGRESTPAIAFPIGALVHHRLTAENLSNFVQDLANVGIGEGEVAHSRVGSTANFKTLKQGPNTTITNGVDEVTIESTDTDTSSGANLGSTPDRQGVYVDNTGTQLNLKSLVGGNDIALSADAEEITIDFDGARDPGNIPTGVYTGGEVTISATPGSVDIAAGTGIIVDAFTDPADLTYTFVSWGAQTLDVTPAPDYACSVVINNLGVAEIGPGGLQHETAPGFGISTVEKITLATVSSVGGVVTAVTPFNYAVNIGHHCFYDYYAATGGAFLPDPHKQYLKPEFPRRIKFENGDGTGNKFFILNGLGRGFNSRFLEGHPGSGSETTHWQMFDRSGNFYDVPGIEIDVTQYSPATYSVGGTRELIPGPATAASIILLYHAPEVGVYAEYASAYYDTIDGACADLLEYYRLHIKDGFPTVQNWLLLGALVVRKDATDFTDTNQARLYPFERNNFRSPFFIKSISSISEDFSPVLSGDLQTNGNDIIIQDVTPVEKGRITYDATINGVYLGFIADPTRGFDPINDGGVLAKPGELTLSGSVVELNAFKGGSVSLQVYASPNGVLYGVEPPAGGWEETDTDNADYTFPVLGTWVHIVGLFITIPQDVDVGDRVDAFINLYIINGSSTRGGSIDIGIGIDGVSPATALKNVRIEGGSDAIVPVSITTTSHGGLTTGQTLSVFVRRATQDHAQFDPQLFGSLDPSELIVSVPGGGGTGGSPTDLGNSPGASSVTITSSTGANTVIAGANTGPNGAGVMTEAQVNALAAKIDNGANVGIGEATIFRDKTTTNLNFKRLQQGANITLTNNADEVIIAAAGGGGVPEAPAQDVSYFRNGSLGGGAADWTNSLKDYLEQTQVTAGTGSFAIDPADGQVVQTTVTAGVTYTSFGTPDPKRSFTLQIKMNAAAAVIFPGDASWGDAGAPVFTNGKEYLIGVFGNLDGTGWNMLLGNSY